MRHRRRRRCDLAVGLEQIQTIVDRVLHQTNRIAAGTEQAFEGDVRVQRLGLGAGHEGQRDERGQGAKKRVLQGMSGFHFDGFLRQSYALDERQKIRVVQRLVDTCLSALMQWLCASVVAPVPPVIQRSRRRLLHHPHQERRDEHPRNRLHLLPDQRHRQGHRLLSRSLGPWRCTVISRR